MKQIPLCTFAPERAGLSYNIDVVSTESFRGWLYEHPVYRTNYFSVYLVSDGLEPLRVNGVQRQVGPGTIITSRPGELWEWQPRSALEGPYLYFMDDFVRPFFNDRQFLDHLTFFRSGRPTSFFRPGRQHFDRLSQLLTQIQQEVVLGEAADQHVLRAQLYEVLALLERCIKTAGDTPALPEKGNVTVREDDYIERFRGLASTYFMREHQVEFYADRLCITAGYLNKIVKQALGVSAKQYLSGLLTEEAIRLLRFTLTPMSDIAAELHLDPAYFNRWFRRSQGITPLQFREMKK